MGSLKVPPDSDAGRLAGLFWVLLILDLGCLVPVWYAGRIWPRFVFAFLALALVLWKGLESGWSPRKNDRR